jgi:spore maturation protein CgeB
VRILLTLNKTLKRGNKQIEDTGYQNVFLPLQALGHDVYFYDTVNPEQKSYSKIIESFKPDLIFCCMTGDSSLTPFEPWEEIKRETDTGRTKTFNWFCDDTWRFDNFSSKACRYFNVCSTCEQNYMYKFKEIGYDNIILGAWHSNKDFHPFIEFENKKIDISFAGRIDFMRMPYIDMLKSYNVPLTHVTNVSYEELMMAYSNSKIGLNFSKSPNDPEFKTQLKARNFEIPASNSLLMTEHHDSIENFFEIDKEIITWKSGIELLEKIQFLLKNPQIVEKVCYNGHQRFLKEHESHVRLRKILKEIDRR